MPVAKCTLVNNFAKEDDLFRAWQGLGYYNRARNLHRTAKSIVQDFGGEVPNSYDQLITLPGIGPYTAAAIASFAFGERRAVVDGNVFRVLSRMYEESQPITSSQARAIFTPLASALMDDADPAAFNQAIMNLGAQVCLPKAPLCDSCPWQEDCQAHLNGTQSSFPVKKSKKANVDRYFHFIDITYRGRTLIHKRKPGDIWNGLYQFPLIEKNTPRAIPSAHVLTFLRKYLGIDEIKIEQITATTKQVLSHQNIFSRFYQVHLQSKPTLISEGYKFVLRKNLPTFAFPRSVTLYLHSKHIKS